MRRPSLKNLKFPKEAIRVAAGITPLAQLPKQDACRDPSWRSRL